MFVLGLPSLVLSLAADPGALSDAAHVAADPLGALRCAPPPAYSGVQRPAPRKYKKQARLYLSKAVGIQRNIFEPSILSAVRNDVTSRSQGLHCLRHVPGVQCEHYRL